MEEWVESKQRTTLKIVPFVAPGDLIRLLDSFSFVPWKCHALPFFVGCLERVEPDADRRRRVECLAQTGEAFSSHELKGIIFKRLRKCHVIGMLKVEECSAS